MSARLNRSGWTWTEWCSQIEGHLGRPLDDEENLNVHELHDLWEGGAPSVDVAHLIETEVQP